MKITRRVAPLGLALTLALSGCSLFSVDVESEETKSNKVDDDDAPPHDR